MRMKGVCIAAAAIGLSACFHQVVQTGAPAGTTVVDKEYVATWLWGLIPANELDVRQQCPGGVATIETEQSFMNGLVGLITLGIYTPQHVRVTCSSRSASLPRGATELVAPASASPAELSTFVERAIEESVANHAPVVLRF
jgi:hypothetical protein